MQYATDVDNILYLARLEFSCKTSVRLGVYHTIFSTKRTQS